jgi:ABC-type methionine transport system permease subunit
VKESTPFLVIGLIFVVVSFVLGSNVNTWIPGYGLGVVGTIALTIGYLTRQQELEEGSG